MLFLLSIKELLLGCIEMNNESPDFYFYCIYFDLFFTFNLIHVQPN